MQPIDNETVGLDIGPATIAIVGDTKAKLDLFAEAVVRDHRWIRKLQRKKDHKRRDNNPEYYDEKGYAIKGKHPMKKSRHQREIEMVIAELHRKTLHGQLANQVMAMGTHINTEKLSYKALQKRFGRSTSLRAPKLFLSILTHRGKRAGRQVEEFSTYHTALSQTCICGRKHKKRLSERVHACDCGVVMQRDLFSAYLAKYVEEDRLQVDKAYASWQGAKPTCQWKATAFLLRRRPSGKESLLKHKTQDVVAMAQANVRACESAKV